jgi:hypothetical protein
MTYKIQIDDLVRDATDEEIAFFEELKAKETELKAEAEAKAAQRLAIADRLGLSVDELATLLS